MGTNHGLIGVRRSGSRSIDIVGTALCLGAGAFFAWRGVTALAGGTADGPTAVASLAGGAMLLVGAWGLSPRAKRTLGGYAVALLVGLALLGTMLTGEATARQVDALDRAAFGPILAFQRDGARVRLARPVPPAPVDADVKHG